MYQEEFTENKLLGSPMYPLRFCTGVRSGVISSMVIEFTPPELSGSPSQNGLRFESSTGIVTSAVEIAPELSRTLMSNEALNPVDTKEL